MRILVTNDDGILAPGIAALADALAPLGHIDVIAPESGQSGAAHAITFMAPLITQRVTVGGKTRFVCVDGPEFDGHQVDFDNMMKRLRAYKPQEDAQHTGFAEATANVYGNGHTSLYADMINAIETDRAPYVDARAGRRALELVLAIYKSELTGEPVHFPLKDFASTDMEGRFDG